MPNGEPITTRSLSAAPDESRDAWQEPSSGESTGLPWTVRCTSTRMRGEVQVTLVDQNDSFISGFPSWRSCLAGGPETSCAAPTGTSPNPA
jgi:hypothetical protein